MIKDISEDMMDKLVNMQNDSLKELCDRLNKRYVAARLVEDSKILTVLLPFDVKGEDIFMDVFFMQQDERMQGVSFVGLRAEIADISKVEGAALLELCIKLSMLNDSLPLGGYGTTLAGDGLHLDKLVFSAAIPMSAIKNAAQMTDLIDNILSMSAQTIKNSVTEIL